MTDNRPMNHEDCAASHCPPPGSIECVWPECYRLLVRDEPQYETPEG